MENAVRILCWYMIMLGRNVGMFVLALDWGVCAVCCVLFVVTPPVPEPEFHVNIDRDVYLQKLITVICVSACLTPSATQCFLPGSPPPPVIRSHRDGCLDKGVLGVCVCVCWLNVCVCDGNGAV